MIFFFFPGMFAPLEPLFRAWERGVCRLFGHKWSEPRYGPMIAIDAQGPLFSGYSRTPVLMQRHCVRCFRGKP